jgi:archaellum component FlaC
MTCLEERVKVLEEEFRELNRKIDLLDQYGADDLRKIEDLEEEVERLERAGRRRIPYPVA